MATLRAFQNEIEEIHAKNAAAEQQKNAAATLANEKDKKGKGKDVVDASKKPSEPVIEVDDDDEELAGIQVCHTLRSR
jgi:hypothetical protein